jgi:hypothetical protein
MITALISRISRSLSLLFYKNRLVLRFSRMKFNLKLLLSGMRHVECWKLASVSENITIEYHPEDGNCNVCRNVSTFDAAHPRKLFYIKIGFNACIFMFRPHALHESWRSCRTSTANPTMWILDLGKELICGLFNDSLSSSNGTAKMNNWAWRKRSWPNLRCYPGICLEVLRETTKNLSQDKRSPGRVLNSRPPE